MKMKYMAFPLLSGAALLLGGCGYNSSNSLVVFNYGEYLDQQIIDSFEKETGIKILYEEYQSPEEMYMKYKADIVDYDVICSSDYILEKLREEGELQPVNFDNVPNAANVEEHLWEFSRSFDPENKYTIPHYWGTLGILYNTRLVDELVDSWDILFDPKYSGQIIMENSVRDTFVPALKKLGHSINTTDKAALDEAKDLLSQQRPMVQAYLTDEARDELIAENASIALVYSGEAPYAREYNKDLAYVVPKEGSNVWVDSWAITNDCRNTENAEKFLNYLLQVDISELSFEYNHYGTPNKKLKDILDEEYTSDPALFPPDEVLDNCEIFKALDSDTQNYYSKLWKDIKLED
jgi:spermidine/putrescine transport system permease protein